MYSQEKRHFCFEGNFGTHCITTTFFLILYCNHIYIQVLPHECKICDKKFSYPSQLKRHHGRYHEDKSKKKYPCPKREGFNCMKVFETWSEARKHAAVEHKYGR